MKRFFLALLVGWYVLGTVALVATAQTEREGKFVAGRSVPTGDSYTLMDGPWNGGSCIIAIGIGAMQNALAAKRDIVIGAWSGLSITDESDIIIMGFIYLTPSDIRARFSPEIEG